jgi:hypothetical protein
MRFDPFVQVICDKCKHDVEINVSGAGDPDSEVDRELRSMGWMVIENGELCQGCKEELLDENGE